MGGGNLRSWRCGLECIVTISAPEQFGDTILFTTDDDILEAIFCYDETYDEEAKSGSSLWHEEELKRPRTADGEGEERPFTQAGSRAEGQQVGCDQQLSNSEQELRRNGKLLKWGLHYSSKLRGGEGHDLHLLVACG